MDVSSMLSGGGPQEGTSSNDMRRQNHQYPTRQAAFGHDTHHASKPYAGAIRNAKGSSGSTYGSAHPRGSPAKKDQKHVVFQLIDDKDPRIQARLPMRVMISPHDTTESIITTVKNFYGLYDYGVSFENQDGISIIAAFDNFDNDMTVLVRTVSQPSATHVEQVKGSISPKRPTLGAPIEMRPPHLHGPYSPSRSAARSAGVRSVSPQSELGRRSVSVAPGAKPRMHRAKSRDNGAIADADGYSSGDNGSVASSRRSKAEEIKAEITVDNIVEGGRRKRAFESSELPLFVPPQVPMSASISSISPQRRSGPHAASPYAYSNQQTFSYTQPLPSPQSYSNGSGFMQPPFPTNPYQNGAAQPNRQLRGSRVSYGSNRHSNGGILPTPDPTIGSVISDEDVALQLMRLGDPTAFSHGRTSTSTVNDDALSGKAEAASSDEEMESDDDEAFDHDDEHHNRSRGQQHSDNGPQRKKQRMLNDLPSDGTSGEEYEDLRDGTFGSDAMNVNDAERPSGKLMNKSRNGSSSMKSAKPRTLSMSKPKKASLNNVKVPMSPASLPSQSRKASISSSINFQHQLGVDEEDLSSKPRCQRCRKSKKGCDRQRPCGRCKDAGLTADDCISEDEGNGRKGRYGRHMGVTIKKAEETMVGASPPPAPAYSQTLTPTNGAFLAPALPDKNNMKKRKR